MKNKEKIILFTCDISGTFSNTKNPENKFDKYKKKIGFRFACKHFEVD